MPHNITMNEAASMILSWDNILVISHASPDGDTMGSASGLIRVLENMGKKTGYLCSDPVPDRFRYLFEGTRLEVTPENAEHIMTVDVADPKLLGKLYDEYKDRVELAIDHHETHVPFAENEWVEGNSPSNCELMYMMLKENGLKIDPETASCLYTGIATDTGCFKYASVLPRTHRIAAELMELKADCARINRVMFDTKTKAEMEAEKLVLAELEFYCDNKVAGIYITNAIKEETGAKDDELEAFPSIPRMIEGVLVGITVKEKSDGEWKASVRAVEPADASAICRVLGGGGHKGAAGCSFYGITRQEAMRLVVEEAEKQLRACGEL